MNKAGGLGAKDSVATGRVGHNSPPNLISVRFDLNITNKYELGKDESCPAE